MKSYYWFLTVLMIAPMLTACRSDNKEDLLPPASGCDTVAMTYTDDIDTVMSKQCISCHAGQFPSAGIRLETYNQVKAQAPGMLDNIKHDPALAQAKHMPQGMPKLDDCTIRKIEAWVNQGMPQ